VKHVSPADKVRLSYQNENIRGQNMAKRLFEGSWHARSDDAIRKAVAQVERLDREIFADPSLAGALQKIAENQFLDVATINRNGISGERHDVERKGRDAWGEERVFRESVLSVRIPFTGDQDSFKFAPSRSSIVYADSVEKNALVLTVPDDATSQNKVDTFVSQVQQNLDVLRAEYEQFKPQLQQAINAAVERRKQKIAAERARDSNLNFPVR
jgi:hypothetical protein